MAMALPARIALAAVATKAAAAPIDFSEALIDNLGAADTNLTLLVGAILEDAPAFRPVNDGMETAAEVTVAIFSASEMEMDQQQGRERVDRSINK